MPDNGYSPASHFEASPPAPPAPARATPGLAIVVAVAAVAALYYGREVLLPITLAVLLSFLLSPLVELLRRAWLGRILSVIVAVVLAVAIILTVGAAIGTQVAQLAKNFPQYETTISEKISSIRDLSFGTLTEAAGRLGQRLGLSAATQPAAPAPAPADAGVQAAQEKPVPVVVTEPPPSGLQISEKLLSPVLSPLATAGIIFVVTIFTLLQKEDLRDRAIRLFGTTDLQRSTAAMTDAGRRLSRYFLNQLGINTGFGVIVAIGLYFIGVPSPILWGVLGTLFRFIPYIGSWIAAALPIALAAAVAPGWSMAIWTAALYAVTELTMGQVVEPLLYGHSTGLSPLAVIIAAIFWTWVWGPVGLIISTPLTLCLVLLGRYVDALQFFDVLLGDRPALTPVESFYQRMLADDPDEAESQAERFLDERPLSSYYDDVALKGLQLAANDVTRGTLRGAKLERLKEALMGLVNDLASYEDAASPSADERKTIAGPAIDVEAIPDRQPAPAGTAFDKSHLAAAWRGETPVLCVAGRGPLDEAASGMLAQLLEKHGLGARIVPHEVVSRAKIGAIDTRGVAMICISYLEISGNPAHLRYLLRRLRNHLPQASLLVGLWPARDPILNDKNVGRAVGADYYVSTLSEAVAICVAGAQKTPTRRPAPADSD